MGEDTINTTGPEPFGSFDLSRLNHAIGEKEIKEASDILAKYKSGKANLDRRVVEDEEWWELRYWRYIHGEQRGKVGEKTEGGETKPIVRSGPEPTSGWLFNAILGKHADAMDNYPEPTVLPRERSDEISAKTLSEVLPVIMDYNDFEATYDENWWEKLKHGTAVYGVFWNPEKENGLGDIDIRAIDLLKIYWEPGIKDIQKSRNLFICELVDEDILQKQYPQYKKRLTGHSMDIPQYIYNDAVDTSTKVVVVDWYYKVNLNGKTIVHYCKFANDVLLYASENDPAYRDRGYYDHGKYPVVMDVLFPEKGTPAGFGYVAICKDPQMYIDKLSANILENSMMNTKKRWFVSESTNINTDEFLDWNNPFVHVQGELSDARIQEITTEPLGSIYLQVVQQKIEEMKDTAANRDINSGGTSHGVSAASAIAALQEAGNKTSRDMIAASYRAQSEISTLCVELIRQFYDEARSFRITAPNGEYEYAQLSNAGLKDQMTGMLPDGTVLYRKPVFDLKISAQRRNPFSRMEQNERAKELYGLGFFNPERAQEALMALEMMDFEGIDKIKEKVQEGQTLLNIVQQQQQQIAQLAGLLTGQPVMPNQPAGGSGAPPQENVQAPEQDGSRTLASGIMAAHTPMTSYGQRLAKRSTPDMNLKSAGAAPV